MRPDSLPRCVSLIATPGGYIGIRDSATGEQLASSRTLNAARHTLARLGYRMARTPSDYRRPRV